jgi:hypothetical protein
MGINTPLKKIIGNLKRFARVWASKTSFTATETKAPRLEKTNAEIMRDGIRKKRLKRGKEKKKSETMSMADETTNPKNAPPNIFPARTPSRETGAKSKRSKEPNLRSKVMTTASMEVEPKRIVIPRSPGIKSIIPFGFLR